MQYDRARFQAWEAEALAVLVPYKDITQVQSLDLPAPVLFYDGHGVLPANPDSVEFWAMPHPPPRASLSALREARNLKVLQLTSSGFDHVLPFLHSNVTLCNAPGLRAEATAEAGMCLILASLNDVATWVIQKQQRLWNWPAPREGIAGKRVLLIGFGAIGQALSRMLSGFGTEIIPLARRPRSGVAGSDELPGLIPEADIVVLAVPLTSATRHLIDAEKLSLMKAESLIVNISRGEVLDTDALVEELRRGRIRAALDVTDPEPLPEDHPLWGFPNALISPHIGGHIKDFEEKASRFIVQQLRRYYSGERLECVVETGT
jgi:phosphoglycerate dehydrogenase-like enzyme